MVNAKMLINLFHIFVVVPFFLYIGYHKETTAPSVFTFLMFLGLFVFMYHAYRYWITGWSINMMHLFIGTFLILIGYYGESLPSAFFNVFYLLAFIVFTWHSYLLYSRLETPVVPAITKQ